MFLFSRVCALLLEIIFVCLPLDYFTFALIKRSILVLQQDNSACQVQQKGCKACFSNCVVEASWLSRPPLFWDWADQLISVLKCEVVVDKSWYDSLNLLSRQSLHLIGHVGSSGIKETWLSLFFFPAKLFPPFTTPSFNFQLLIPSLHSQTVNIHMQDRKHSWFCHGLLKHIWSRHWCISSWLWSKWNSKRHLEMCRLDNSPKDSFTQGGQNGCQTWWCSSGIFKCYSSKFCTWHVTFLLWLFIAKSNCQ